MNSEIFGLVETSIGKWRTDKDVVALAELTVDVYNYCRHCPGGANELGMTEASMLRRMKSLFKELTRRAHDKSRRQEASALVLAMGTLLWKAAGLVLRDYDRSMLVENLTAGIVNEFEAERKHLLTDAEYLAHLYNIPSPINSEEKLKERKARKIMAAWADGYDTEKGWSDCSIATRLGRLDIYVRLCEEGDNDEPYVTEAGHIIDCDKGSFSNDELIAFSDMVEDLVEWYSPNKTQLATSRRELKAELEKRRGGEDDYAVRCAIARLAIALHCYDTAAREVAERDARFADEVLAPIVGVKITPELTDAECAALAVAYIERHDMLSYLDEGYSPEAVRYCGRRMSELVAALIDKEKATDDVCRKAGYIALMGELCGTSYNNVLTLTYAQQFYSSERLAALKSAQLPAEAEAMLLQAEVAKMYDATEEDWQRLRSVADRWVAEYAADQWAGLDDAAKMARISAITTLFLNTSYVNEKRAEYKAIAEAATKSVADKLLADGDELSLVRLYHVAVALHADSNGFFSGESCWRDLMHSVAAALTHRGAATLTARAIAVAEAAWVAKTVMLEDYR